jgi:tetratricopeptide (TPR) repeat protein
MHIGHLVLQAFSHGRGSATPLCKTAPALDQMARIKAAPTLPSSGPTPASLAEIRGEVGREASAMAGKRAALNGRFSEAIVSFDRALDVDGKDAAILAWRAAAYAAKGRPGLGLQDSAHALRLDPQSRLARIVRASLLSDTDPAGALEMLNSVLQKDPADEHALLCKAVIIFGKMNEWEEGLKALQQLIAINPRNDAALATFAIALVNNKYLWRHFPNAKIAALGAARKAHRLNPSNSMAQVAMIACGDNCENVTAPTPSNTRVRGAFYLPLGWRDPKLQAEVS